MTTIAVILTLVTIVGILLSAWLSGAETGLYTINRVRLTVRSARGDRAAKQVQHLLGDSDRTLSVLLLGNNIANYMSTFGIAGLLAMAGMGEMEAVAVNALILIPLLFVFGEVLPKDLFRVHTDRWSYAGAAALMWLSRLLTIIPLAPIVAGFGRLVASSIGGDSDAPLEARERIARLLEEGAGAGVLSKSQTELIDRALAMRGLTVETEMVPWDRVQVLQEDLPPSRIGARLAERTYARLPVINTTGRVVGIIHALDVALTPATPLKDLLHTAWEIRPDTNVHDALHLLRRDHTPIAIVTEEDGGTPLGIVTIKDLVEPLVGDLRAW
jgi:putative hemolysin